jgi:hypothetical protein
MVSSPFSLHPLIQVLCQYISSLNTNILLIQGGDSVNDLHRKHVNQVYWWEGIVILNASTIILANQ